MACEQTIKFWWRSGSISWHPDPYRDTGKTCLGRGMHCHSASSYIYHSVHNFQTTGQSTLTWGRIAATHGRFSGTRQCAPHLIHASLGPPKSSTKRHLDRSTIFAGLIPATDHATWSNIIGLIYVYSTAMRPKNIQCKMLHFFQVCWSKRLIVLRTVKVSTLWVKKNNPL